MASGPILKCDDLVVRHGEVIALDRVSIRVGSGERVALIGPSGAGKSSLLNVIGGLVGPTSGSVEVFDSSLTELVGAALRDHRRRVGIVSQHLALAPALRVVHSVNGGRLGSWSTARALSSLVRPRDTADVLAALESVGLADRAQARTGDLSGGEQQRVAVARTLLQAPRLVLADEPTSSVDPKLSDQVMGLLCPPDPKWAVVVSVHDPELAFRHADRVVGLSDGRVAFDRPVTEVDPADVVSLYEQT